MKRKNYREDEKTKPFAIDGMFNAIRGFNYLTWRTEWNALPTVRATNDNIVINKSSK